MQNRLHFIAHLQTLSIFLRGGFVLLKIQYEGHIHGLVIRIVLMANLLKTGLAGQEIQLQNW